MYLNQDQPGPIAPLLDKEQLYERALDHLRLALELLDRAGAPPQIGARVDHAIHDLYVASAELIGGGRVDQIERNAAPQ